MNKYSEYFDIDEGYFPEINPSSIKDPSNKWENTFPHKTFIDLLKATERMLGRNSKKGIWIEGAYGTGKSRVAWALKSLLDCSSDQLKAYFSEYDALQKEPDLRDKLLGHKDEEINGKIITAYRYASGSIDSDRALIVAIYESVTKALSEAGVIYKGENTLRGGVVSWLKDEDNEAYFNSIIQRPEYRGLGSFANKSANDIIGLLANPSINVDALMEDIFSLAASKGIIALSTSMDDLIAWLTDVIDQNKLKAIVLVWDEFSAYFKRNRTSLDEFQKLAELSNLKPFYFMIVTHMSGSIFSENDQTGKIVRDRFIHKEIELPDSIAFELIKHALKVKDAQKEIWEELADDLNSRMEHSRNAVRDVVWGESYIGDDVLRGMLPLHPLAALLLKNISSAFASNQRSMFNFIKNAETENLEAFQWFINNHSPGNGDILTIDYLWSFFYEKGTDDHGPGIGKSNLDSMIRTILNTFPMNEKNLLNNEKRVLKTILMMQAISQKFGDSVELFLTTDKNINFAFEGTDLEHDHAVNLAKKLVKDGILYAKPMGSGRAPQYAAAAIAGDQAQIDGIKTRRIKSVKTMSLISEGDFISVLSMPPALRIRYDITTVTIDNFTATINKICNEASTYKLRTVLSFARDDEERNKMRELIKSAVNEERYKDIIFIDASSTVFGGERFEQWIEHVANEEYWRTKDGQLADEMSLKAKDILDTWKMDIANNSFTIYSLYTKTGEPHVSTSSALVALSNIVIRKYPLSFDNANTTEVMWSPSSLLKSATCGIKGTSGNPVPVTAPNLLTQESLGKLRQKVDNLIKTAFENDGRIAIGDICEELMEHGFMPCNLYAFLTGFILKEYALDTYRYSDGETGDRMSIEKLAEIIAECLKHKNTPIARYKEKFIELMTKEQMAFVDFAKVVFNTPDNQAIEQVAMRIRSKLKELNYPIWCLKQIDTYGLEEFIDKLLALANPSVKGDRTAEIAAAIGRMSLQAETASQNLAKLMTVDNAAKAMNEFLSYFEGGDALRLADEINVQDVLLDVKRQISSGEALWLWDQKTGEDEIRKLITDYKIIATSNRINTKSSSLSGCLEEWRDKIKSIRIPSSAVIVEKPQLKSFFRILYDIATSGELLYDKRNEFLSELEANENAFIDFFNSKIEIFKNVYSFYLTGFSNDEAHKLYSNLPTAAFTMDKSEYEHNLEGLAKKVQSEQEKYKLQQLWEEKTSSRSPKEWSKNNRTPILALVSPDDQTVARRVFDTICRNNPEDNEVKFALEFLQSKEIFIVDLSNKAKIDEVFIRNIIGRFIAVLSNADEVRSRLEDVIPAEHYDWYGNKSVQIEIEKFAQAKYNQGGSGKVLEKIEKMDAHKVKEYLRRLVKDNMNVGIEIISDEEI